MFIFFIVVDRADPYFTATAKHFNSLMSRYGAPLVILNLVKVCIQNINLWFVVCNIWGI